MKNIYLLSLLTLFFFACNESTTNNEDKKDTEQTETTNSETTFSKKYPFEAGIIKYESSAMGMQTSLDLYFKDYGKVECSISEMDMAGTKMIMKSITKDGYLYALNMNEKRGTKMKTDSDFSSFRIDVEMLEEKLMQNGGQKLGTEEVLGRTCQIYSMSQDGANSKIWIWETMMLKMETEQNGMTMTMEAKSIEETTNFPKGIFDIPADFNITDEAEMNMDIDDFGDENAAG